MNSDFNKGDISCVNGLINSHMFSQCNESSYFNKMDRDVENIDMSGGYCFIISHTVSENHRNSVDSLKKGLEMFPMYMTWKILDYRMVLT